jgi:GNAT superfamily N-acetyltransferase
MTASALELFPLFYTERQSASAALYLTEPDLVLIQDGTYFVHEDEGTVVACGGWSKRGKLYTGPGPRQDDARMLDPTSEPARVRAMFVHAGWTRRGLGRAILTSCARAAFADGFEALTLMATLPGVPLYRSFGFRETDQAMIPLPDGVLLEGVEMYLHRSMFQLSS